MTIFSLIETSKYRFIFPQIWNGNVNTDGNTDERRSTRNRRTSRDKLKLKGFEKLMDNQPINTIPAVTTTNMEAHKSGRLHLIEANQYKIIFVCPLTD